MLPLNILLLILLGLVFGSFGSVIFFRLGELPNRQTLKGFFFGRSECRHCHHTLWTTDLLPLRSFFSQKGKCRYCNTKLSRWYPTLEIWTVIIFLGTRRTLGMPQPTERIQQASIPTIGIWLLFLIALYDLKQYELHLTASLLFLLLSFCSQRGRGYNLRKALQGTVIFFCVFLVIYFLGKAIAYIKYKKKAEGFGFGDVLAAGILGSVIQVFLPLSSVVERVYFLSSYLIISCLFSFMLLFALHKNATPSNLPFLPGMIVAFLILIRYGKEILHVLLTPS